MRTRKSGYLLIIIGILLSCLSLVQSGCGSSYALESYPTDTIVTNKQNTGLTIQVEFERGSTHNHPLMAVWTTDMDDQYIETIYVAKSIAKGVFGHGDKSEGKWQPGPLRRPAALPVWAHSRGVMEKDSLYIPTEHTPMPDAVTGATPQNNFILVSKLSVSTPEQFKIYFEINQTWDWNEYWTNNKFPDDEDYKTSCQPALVYSTTLKSATKGHYLPMKLIGHSHYNGKNGLINRELSTITTAKNITGNLIVKIVK